MTRRFVLAMSAALLLCSTPYAAEPGLSVGTAPGLQTRGAQLGAPEMRLSLEEAVALALQHNINLEVSRLGLASAEQGFVATTGIFDWLLQSTLGGSYSESPSTNQLEGATVAIERGRTFDLSLGKLLPTGGNVSVGWTNLRSKTNSTFYFLNPYYDSGLTFSLTQPLLRGFGTDVTRSGIEVARRSRDISRVQFEEIVIATAQAVENAYWDLVYAIDDLKVKQHSLQLAQDLLDQTRTRVRIGTSAPIDIVQSEAAVASREVDIIVAENSIGKAADVLKNLMGFENRQDWQSHVVPTDALEVTTETPDLEQSIDAALTRRPELRQRQLEQQIGEINVLAAKNAVRPQLNVGLNYGFTGVGGDQITVDPETGEVISTIPGGWNDALSQLVRRDYNQWTAGLTFSYPLGNTQAKAQLAQQRFTLDSARQNAALTRQAIITDVRTAVRALDASAKAIVAAIKSRELAERNLDAEQKKFANGMSTNFQVVKIQDDLAIAQAAELQARVLYRQAAVVYRVAVGDLLERMGIAIKDEPAPKEPHTGWKDAAWLKFGHYVKAEAAPAPPAEPAQK